VRGAGRFNRAQMDVIAVASLLINDVITAVDVEGIAGYGFRRIMREECDRETVMMTGLRVGAFPKPFSHNESNSGIPDATASPAGGTWPHNAERHISPTI
jgi:hypothetical protein